MGGGDGSSFVLPSLLLGGVLKGETSAVATDLSGARVARVDGSTECDLLGILGLPARFTGGGTAGATDAGRSLLSGSAVAAATVFEGKKCLDSNPGVGLRLGILKDLGRVFEGEACVEGESRAACDMGREGRGDSICGSVDLGGGDFGDCTVTLGGDLVGDLGGENATMLVGRGFELLHGALNEL